MARWDTTDPISADGGASDQYTPRVVLASDSPGARQANAVSHPAIVVDQTEDPAAPDIAADPNRLNISIENIGTVPIWVSLGETTNGGTRGMSVAVGDSYYTESTLALWVYGNPVGGAATAEAERFI